MAHEKSEQEPTQQPLQIAQEAHEAQEARASEEPKQEPTKGTYTSVLLVISK